MWSWVEWRGPGDWLAQCPRIEMASRAWEQRCGCGQRYSNNYSAAERSSTAARCCKAGWGMVLTTETAGVPECALHAVTEGRSALSEQKMCPDTFRRYQQRTPSAMKSLFRNRFKFGDDEACGNG